MENTRLHILHDIFIRTHNGGFITMHEIEVNTALSGSRLRPFLEDLRKKDSSSSTPRDLRSPRRDSFLPRPLGLI